MSDRIDSIILTKAAEHLRLNGADFMRVSAVARDLKMSHANIYRHFANKEALIDAVIKQWLRLTEKRLRDIVDSADPADDKLERFMRELALRSREKQVDDPLFFHVYRKAWLEGRASILEHRGVLRRLIELILDEGMHPGPFNFKDLDRAIDLTTDSFNRFLHPETLYELRDLPKSRFDQRLLAVAKTLNRALAQGFV